jgi:hypothetical protein
LRPATAVDARYAATGRGMKLCMDGRHPCLAM